MEAPPSRYLLKRLVAFSAGCGARRETLADSVANVLHLVADLAADLFAAGGSKQERCANTYAHSGYEGKDIANGMIFAGVKALRPVRANLATRLEARSMPSATRSRTSLVKTVGLVQEIHCGL